MSTDSPSDPWISHPRIEPAAAGSAIGWIRGLHGYGGPAIYRSGSLRGATEHKALGNTE